MSMLPEDCIKEIEEKLGFSVPFCETNKEIVRFGKENKCWLWAASWELNGKEYFKCLYGDWSELNSKYEWKSWSNEKQSRKFTKRYEEIIKEQKEKYAKEKEQRHDECRRKWKPLFDKANQDPTHPYLINKQIQDNYQAKVMRSMLWIPLFDFENGFNGVQIIKEDGKKFSTGVKIKGSFCPVKKVKSFDTIYFCEGYATACSIYLAVGGFVVTCFTANNLINVISSFKEKYPDSKFILCADNDAYKEMNTGVEIAGKIKDKYPDIEIRLPKFQKEETKPTDFNDLHVLEGIEEVRKQIINDENISSDLVDSKFYEKLIEEGFSFTNEHGNTIRVPIKLRGYFNYLYKYIVDRKTAQVYAYKNGIYFKIEDIDIKGFAQKHYKPYLQKDHEAKEFLNTVKRFSINNIPLLIEKSSTSNEICFNNGVYNYKTNELKPNSYRNFKFVKINADKNDDTDCPIWDELLRNLTCNRSYIQDCIEEFIGYCISGMPYNYNKVLIMKGGGANGKTTLIEAISDILGFENTSAVSITMMQTNRFMGSDLEHSLVNFSEEEPPKKVFAETSTLKLLTGNSPIRIEDKGTKAYNIVNRAKLIMSYNEMPYLSDFSEGMRRRLLIIPFDLDLIRKPEMKIKNLKEKLQKERSAIINRCIKALQRLEKNGDFTIIPETKKEITDMMKSSDTVLEWWAENVKITNNPYDRVTFSELYNDYIDEVGHSTKISKLRFGKKIRSIINSINTPETTPLEYKTFKLNGAQKATKGVISATLRI